MGLLALIGSHSLMGGATAVATPRAKGSCGHSLRTWTWTSRRFRLLDQICGGTAMPRGWADGSDN